MSNTKLCFGMQIDSTEWAKALNIKMGESKAPKCEFCHEANTNNTNFCGNCGSDLRRDAVELGPVQIIDLTIMAHREPPRNVKLLPWVGTDDDGNAINSMIYVCRELASSADGVASLGVSPAFFSWKEVGNEIKRYVSELGIDPVDPFLFAMTEGE